MKHIIESQQFSKELLFKLFKKADELRKNPSNSLKGKLMASLFYEPSTRTRLSFEAAMLKLGGSVIGTESAKIFSSAVKGETLEDSIRTISKYVDVIILRHSEEGSAKNASEVSEAHLINAGDGKGQHPTQSLLDVYTIYREFQSLENLKIAIVGDLANGRTARSLCYLLAKFKNNQIIFVSPENLKMNDDLKEYLTKKGVSFKEESDLNKTLAEADVIYMTRIQKERMDLQSYEKAKGKYIINENNLKFVKANSRILHPLPHVEELDIPTNIEDSDDRIAYFRQVENGLYIRMALLNYLINKS
jgi:aspartate carbamoyltransferase catalytic subunit